VLLVLSWLYVLRPNAFSGASTANMASLRKRVSRWMLRSSEDSDTSSVKTSSKNSSMDVNRESLDSGYHSLRALENQDSVLPRAEETPTSVPRKLPKALSTTFTYLSDTIRSGATYMYGEPGNEEHSSLEWSELESQTPRKHLRRRSSLFSSVRRRRTLQNSPTPNAPDESLDESPTPRIVTNEAPTLDDVVIPISDFRDKRRVTTGAAALITGHKLPVSTKIWPKPVRVAVGDISSRHTSFYDPFSPPSGKASAVYSYSNTDPVPSGGRHSFLASGPATSTFSDPSKGYLSNERGCYAEVESDPEQSESESFPAGLKGRHLAASESPKYLMHPTSYKSSPADLYASQGSPTTLGHRPVESSLPATVYGGDAEFGDFSEGSPPSMGSRAVWEQRRAARQQRYLALSPLARAKTLSDDGIEPDLQLSRSPKKAPFDQPDHQDTQIRGSLRLAVEAIDSKSGLVYDLEDSSQETDPVNVDPLEATDCTEAETPPEPPSNEVGRSVGRDLKPKMPSKCLTKNNIVASELDANLEGQKARQQCSQAYDLSALTDSAQRHALQSSSASDATPSLLMNASPSTSLFSRPRLATPFKHKRVESGFSDITDNDCALTTQTPPSIPSAFPILHVRSSPVVADPKMFEALHAHKDGEIPIAGPNNLGFSPSVKQSLPELERVGSSPWAGSSPNISVPNFDSLSSDSQPFTGTAFLFQPKTTPTTKPTPIRKRTPMGEISENVQSIRKPSTPDTKPEYSISQFSPKAEATTQYTGHELESEQPTIVQNSEISPTHSNKRCVCFAPKPEIIRDIASRSPNSSKNLRRKASKKAIQKEMEAKQELALKKFTESLKSDEEKIGALKAEEVEEVDSLNVYDEEDPLQFVTLREVDSVKASREESVPSEGARLCEGVCLAWVDCKVCWENDEWMRYW